jgi:hypothetical protein
MIPPEWARPRVGQKVRLRTGTIVEVVSVRKCNDVLRLQSEVEAMFTGSRLRATYGPQWQSIYYEAQGVSMVTFRPNEVLELLP